MGRIVSTSCPLDTVNAQLCEMRWPGFRPVAYEINSKGTLVLTLKPLICHDICPHCGRRCSKVHARQWRQAIDAPFFPGQRTAIKYQALRFRCPDCGRTFTMEPSFIAKRARVTNAMILHSQTLMRIAAMTLTDVAKITGLSDMTLRKFDKEQLKFCYENVNFNGVQNIAIDEFSVHKNHRYATVVIDNDTCQVLWVGRGKAIKCVQPFFDLLKQRGIAENIRSVACDQNAAYPRLVRENLPNATIIYDFFHVMAHMRADVLAAAKKVTQERVAKRVSDELTHKARQSGQPMSKTSIAAEVHRAVKRLTGSDWMMVAPSGSLSTGKQQKLKTMLADNALLASLYPTVDQLRALWREKDPHVAEQRLNSLARILLDISKQFDFKPAKKFALMLRRRRDGIYKAGAYGYSTNRLEGVNNKIKVLKRTAYGFRDEEYFFLRIKREFPGKGCLSMADILDQAAVISGTMWHGAWTSIRENPCCNHAQV